ncbi:transposase [bacterium]|nr:transposase [bacterium]
MVLSYIGAKVLFDVSSSSYHGRTCVLAMHGYNRDGEKLPSIVYGILTDRAGCPVAVDVYPGNTGDPTTVPDQVEKLRERFGLDRVVLVGDRGMLTQTQISALHEYPAQEKGKPRSASINRRNQPPFKNTSSTCSKSNHKPLYPVTLHLIPQLTN